MIGIAKFVSVVAMCTWLLSKSGVIFSRPTYTRGTGSTRACADHRAGDPDDYTEDEIARERLAYGL